MVAVVGVVLLTKLLSWLWLGDERSVLRLVN